VTGIGWQWRPLVDKTLGAGDGELRAEIGKLVLRTLNPLLPHGTRGRTSGWLAGWI
jgi:hypothetical protein